MPVSATLNPTEQQATTQEGEPYILLVGGVDAALSTLGLLEAQQVPVVYRESGAEALELLATAPPVLIILNLSLSDRDEIGVCRAMHTGSASPILVVSAKRDERSLVAMLDSGADDYVVAPVRADEFRARVRAILRRGNATVPVNPPLLFGELEIDIVKRRVKRAGRHVPLTRTEFDILLVLAQHRDQIQSQETILRLVWGPYHGEYIQTLRVHIGHIRSKLESVPSRPQYILTEPGVGYWFNSSALKQPN